MYIYFLISLFVVFIDWLTKFCVRTSLTLGQVIEICPFLNLVYIRNKGISFSFMTNASPWFLTIVASLISIGVAYCLITEKNRFVKVCFALILGGAIGNIIDRVYLGSVVDFIDFYVGQWHWPAFNVADSAICIGVALLVYHSLFMKEKK